MHEGLEPEGSNPWIELSYPSQTSEYPERGSTTLIKVFQSLGNTLVGYAIFYFFLIVHFIQFPVPYT